MTLQINTDGGSRGNPGRAAYGVVYTMDGVPQLEKSGFLGIATNNEAEYQGLIVALENLPEFLKNNAVKSVVIKMDSNLVVQQVNGAWKTKDARMRDYVVQARQLLQQVAIPVRLEYVPRAQNSEADRLVNKCLDQIALQE
ncbi:ribonuclease HI family protein [Candidatus Woesebacteria bacterium]|nr:ribonuclease HI family protein [Candidatus Woesebacteria bacterium]MCD8507014.1 ribonuclease HI family protein [Candidatus Woesebacteria bacterium]MCD8527305.1 ribonuclease HI family protein [Candidatus Woesebacteria bacterium]MCD8546670.1 ribonuclease HI family protein [Candidatus Woesebacteria bacterium]